MSFPAFRQLIARTACVSSAPHKFASLRFMSVFSKQYENILTARPEPGVALVTLNRPKALNALNSALFAELNDALRLIDADKEIGAIVLTGSERAFAGACRLSVGVVHQQKWDSGRRH
jgi:enoyl-CoA hydratase